MTNSKRLQIGGLGLLVTGIALYFIVTQLDLQLFAESWRTANYWYVLPCLVLLFIGLITRAFRWRLLLDNRLSFNRTFSIMNIAYLVNGVLPLRIGEVARVYLVSRTRESIPMPLTASTIIIERLLDLFAVVMIVFVGLILGPVPAEIRSASMIAAGAALIGFVVLIVLAANRERAAKLFSGVQQRLPLVKHYPVLADWFDQFLDGLQPLARPQILSLSLGWTILSWVVSIAAGYVLMFAFFDDGSIAATMLYIAAVAFAIALPAVPGNIGIYEASILLALTAMGYEQSSTAVAFAVMVHAVNIFAHVSTGVVGFMQEGISIGQLSQGVRNMQGTTETG